jgi:hypothetical protein
MKGLEGALGRGEAKCMCLDLFPSATGSQSEKRSASPNGQNSIIYKDRYGSCILLDRESVKRNLLHSQYKMIDY